MPDIKFSQFAAGGDLQPTDQVVGLRAGVNTIFDVDEDSVAFTANIVIASNGNDSAPNDGSFSKPFLTLARVNAVAAANPGTLYRCLDYRVSATEATFTPQPNVRYFANNTLLTVSSAMTLGSNWSALSTQATLIQGYVFITAATSTFDMSSLLSANNHQIIWQECTFIGGGTFIFKGLVTDYIPTPLPVPYVQIIDCSCSAYNTTAFTYTFQEGIFVDIQGGNSGGINISMSTDAEVRAQCRILNCDIRGAVTVTATSTVASLGYGINLQLTNSRPGGLFTINANQTASYVIGVAIDANSYREPVINGSGGHQIEPGGYAEGIRFPITNMYYVSGISGKDYSSATSYRGEFGEPFRTVAFAATQVVAPCCIVILDADQIEGSQISLPANVHLTSFSPNCIIYNALPITINPATFGSSGQRNYISNIRFTGAVDIDLSSVSSSYSILTKFYNVQVDSTFTYNGNAGLAGLYLNNTTVGGASTVTNATMYGTSNSFNAAFNLGSNTLNIASTTFISKNDRFTSIAVTANAAEVLPSSALIEAASISSTVAASGAEAKVYFDVASWKTVTLTNGAPAPVLLSNADGLNSNYTPTYYTPTNSSVKGALAGLDTKLAVSARGVVIGPAAAGSPFDSTVLTNGQLLIGRTGNSPAANTLSAGEGITITTGSGTITVSSAADSASNSGYMYGFSLMQGPGAKQAQITVGVEDVCSSADNSFFIVGPSPSTNIVLDMTVSGAGGLDAGSAISDMRYFVFVIADSTGTNDLDLLASLSLAPTLPAGYDKFRCIGSVKTKRASTDLVEFYYRGYTDQRTFVFLSAPNESAILSAGTATTLTQIDMWPVISTDLTFNGILSAHFTPSATSDEFDITQHLNANALTRISGSNPQWSQVQFDTGINGRYIDYKVSSGSNSLDLYVTEFTECL